jgi:hypothetical protein
MASRPAVTDRFQSGGFGKDLAKCLDITATVLLPGNQEGRRRSKDALGPRTA